MTEQTPLEQAIEHQATVNAKGTELMLDKLTGAIMWVICRKCNKEHAKWKHPYCRYCWKKYFKHTNYIPTKDEIEKYSS